MDQARASELLATERARLEAEIDAWRVDGALESTVRTDPGDRGSENLYEDEFGEGRLADLRDQLAAVERAEARLAEGVYGLSVASGEPIPDERLEAVPTAERTVEEEDRLSRGLG